MTDTYFLLLAYEIAVAAHSGQFRRDGKTPYIAHPIDVAKRVETPTLKAIALLHDVLEDCPEYTADRLVSLGIPREIVDAVVKLTKLSGEDYFDRIAIIKQCPLARAVKAADITSNLSDAPTDKQVQKYKKALAQLILA